LFGALKSFCFPDNQHKGQCRQGTYPRMRHQEPRLRALLGYLLDRQESSKAVGQLYNAWAISAESIALRSLTRSNSLAT